MQVDRHLDIAQRLGGRRKWRGFADQPEYAARIFCRASVSCGDSLVGKGRQNREAARAQQALELRTRMNLAVHLLTGERRHDPKTQSTDAHQRQRQADLRGARRVRRRGDRDDTGLGRGERLLLHRLGEAGQEGLVDAAIGIGGGLQFAQADLRLPGRAGRLEHLHHAPVDGFFLAPGDLKLALVALADPRNFIPDRALQRRHFRPQVSRGLVIGAVAGAPLGFLVLIVEELLTQLGDDGVAQRIGDDRIGNVEGFLRGPLLQNALDAVEPGLGLAGIRARLRKRHAELIKLDFARQLAVDADDDAVLGLEVLHFLVGVAGLLAQFADALFEPDAGAMGGFELGLKLVFDIGVGERVGDPRRLVAVERGVGDLFDVAASQSGDAQIVFQRSNHAAQHLVVRRLRIRS